MKQPPIQLPPGAVAYEPDFTRKRQLTQEEIAKLSDKVLKRMDKIDKIAEELASHTKTEKARITELATENVSDRKIVKQGYEEETIGVFLHPNHAEGVMEYIDGDEVVFSRPLYPSEKQFSISNAAANE